MSLQRFSSCALLLWFQLAGFAAAATVWTSPITGAVTWTKADGPHTWSGDLNVNSGGLVAIEPGAVVQMPSAGHWRINGGGQVLALGSAEDPIRIGGASESAPGDTLWLDSPLTSEFRFCHFANLSRIRISQQSPQANPLFEHCIFRKFTGHCIELINAPARILHGIFRDNPVGMYGVSMTCSVFSDETCPTIWYNAFDRNGLALWTPADIWLGDYDFFRYNRVAGGVGIAFRADKYGHYHRFRLLDCDLGNTATSLVFSGYGSGWDGSMDAMSIERCHLSILTQAAFNFSNVTNLSNNYWGTTDPAAIDAALFGGGVISTNAVVPISPTNVFPQADVDNSDGGNRTRQADADRVKQAVVGLVALDPGEAAIADVDRNGAVDARDALLIESYLNGLIWKLPVP